MIHRRNVYHARKARLFSRIPAQPTSEVKTPRDAAVVVTISSVRFPTRMMSACVQTLNQINRQAMSPVRQYAENCQKIVVSYGSEKRQRLQKKNNGAVAMGRRAGIETMHSQ